MELNKKIIVTGILLGLPLFYVNANEISDLISDKESAEPYVNLGGRLYYFEATIYASWYQAFEFCRRLDMFLVSVETAEEYELIENHIGEIGLDWYWTSGNDLANIGEYVWASTGEKVTFFDWEVNQPDHAGNLEFCIHMRPDINGTLGWNDMNPLNSIRNHFICEQL